MEFGLLDETFSLFCKAADGANGRTTLSFTAIDGHRLSSSECDNGDMRRGYYSKKKHILLLSALADRVSGRERRLRRRGPIS